jgi:MinD-like ATPase involved in chromosome partitioning or flagellar assembly
VATTGVPEGEGSEEGAEPSTGAAPAAGPGALAVLSAIPETDLEAQLVAALARRRLGVTVVRRCVDLPDLLSAAATGTAVAALVSSGLRRFDQDALARLQAAGVAVVGILTGSSVTESADAAEIRLRQMGLGHIVSAGAGSQSGTETGTADVLAVAVADAVRAAMHALIERSRTVAPRGPAPTGPLSADVVGGGDGPAEDHATGTQRRLVAVWGPTGAPGRSLLSWQLAGEAAAAGWSALVIDADVYGGSTALLAGLVDEAPGLVAACRAANAGSLDVGRLATLARRVDPSTRDAASLAVLTGISRAHRWPEIRPAALGTVLFQARVLADLVVVDCGFSLEDDEELSYDTIAPRRNAATLAALAAADEVLVVGSAEPIGLTRLIAGLPDLRHALSTAGTEPPLRVVVNRVRDSARERRAVRAAVERHAGIEPSALLPLDVEAADRAQTEGRLLLECAPRSPLRSALTDLTAVVRGESRPEPRRRARWPTPSLSR